MNAKLVYNYLLHGVVLENICYTIILLSVNCFSKSKARQLVDQGITVIPVIIGDEVNKEHVKPLTDDEDRIAPVKPTDKPKDVTNTIDEQIKKAIKGTLIHHGENLQCGS